MDAMQLHKRRKEAAAGLRKAIEDGDVDKLRIAIERALTGHVRQKDVDNARESLKKLEKRKEEAQKLEQARTVFEQRLRIAAETKSPEKLLCAIEEAESDANLEARALPRE